MRECVLGLVEFIYRASQRFTFVFVVSILVSPLPSQLYKIE